MERVNWDEGQAHFLQILGIQEGFNDGPVFIHELPLPPQEYQTLEALRRSGLLKGKGINRLLDLAIDRAQKEDTREFIELLTYPGFYQVFIPYLRKYCSRYLRILHAKKHATPLELGDTKIEISAWSEAEIACLSSMPDLQNDYKEYLEAEAEAPSEAEVLSYQDYCLERLNDIQIHFVERSNIRLGYYLVRYTNFDNQLINGWVPQEAVHKLFGERTEAILNLSFDEQTRLLKASDFKPLRKDLFNFERFFLEQVQLCFDQEKLSFSVTLFVRCDKLNEDSTNSIFTFNYSLLDNRYTFEDKQGERSISTPNAGRWLRKMVASLPEPERERILKHLFLFGDESLLVMGKILHHSLKSAHQELKKPQMEVQKVSAEAFSGSVKPFALFRAAALSLFLALRPGMIEMPNKPALSPAIENIPSPKK